MTLKGKRIGFALTGSFCTLAEALVQMQAMADEGAEIQPILSYHVQQLDTRFFTREALNAAIRIITDRSIWTSIPEVEPIGPKKLLDLLVVAPCTGNSLAKLVHGITDTPVLMAAKAQLRNQRPLVLAVCTNDGLAINGHNIGAAGALRGVYVTPYRQDDPIGKPASLVACMEQLIPTCQAALDGEQLQPILRG